MKYFLVLLSIINFHFLVNAQNTEPIIIPDVQSWKGGSGSVNIEHAKIIVASPDLLNLGKIIQDEYEEITGKEISVKQGTKKEANGSFFLKLTNKSIPKEGYELNIDEVITLEGSTPAGVFYASRTLLQLITQNTISLAKGKITDAPKYPVRSILLDVGRKFHSVEILKDWIRVLSYFKMNEIHLHLNDVGLTKYSGFRVQVDAIPGLTSTDGFYSKEDIRELQDFAKARGLTLIPEIDTPGHSGAFTKVRPDLMHPKLGDPYLDITNEETYRFIETVLDEVIPQFDAPHFHIGTDEYRLHSIKDSVEKELLGEKFRQYINHFNRYIREKHGKTVRIWSGYELMPGTTEADKNIIIDMWETDDASKKSKEGYQFINSSHYYTYICAGVKYYGVDNPFLYDDWSLLQFSDKPGATLSPKDKGLLGGKIHVWGDRFPYGYNHNELGRLVMPTVLVASEKFWGTKGAENFDAFTKRADLILPGDDVFEFVPSNHSIHNDTNIQLGNVPGSKFLLRSAPASEDGVVWELNDTLRYMTIRNNEKLNIGEGVKNLEYPWTASFTVTRFTDKRHKRESRPNGHEILLTSDWGTIFLDYDNEIRDRKTKEVLERKNGLAIVRATNAPESQPDLHLYRDLLFFDYKVPLHEKVEITFVGKQHRTELLINGKFFDAVDIQTLCPIEFLGGDNNDSFNGILHKAVIYNYDASDKIKNRNK